jgi:hypothetical protein
MVVVPSELLMYPTPNPSRAEANLDVMPEDPAQSPLPRPARKRLRTVEILWLPAANVNRP